MGGQYWNVSLRNGRQCEKQENIDLTQDEDYGRAEARSSGLMVEETPGKPQLGYHLTKTVRRVFVSNGDFYFQMTLV